ncbi:MAG: class GN sortase [Thermoanaerobaculia bacterium]
MNTLADGGPALLPVLPRDRQECLSSIRRSTLVVLFLIGVCLIGQGAWIYGKARLAQTLLEVSWRRGIKPWPWADTRAIAKLEVGGSRIVVLSGASGRTMAFGPGHLDGSALPGVEGNCVITAHRDTHFAALRYVVPGDLVKIERADGMIVEYEVTQTRVVDRNDTSVLRDDGTTRLTLITCWPFDAVIPGGPLRYVVVAEAAAVDQEVLRRNLTFSAP